MKAKQNIILIGFMASGKSRVGQLLARRLDYKLIDLDHVIEERTGQTIKHIFLEKGEAHFRALELEVLKTLENSSSTVIVTGGGTPLFYASAQALKKLGRIYFLDASFDLVIKRLENSTKRPLALAKTPEERADLRELYYYRRPIYELLGSRIDVNHQDQARSVEEIAERFLAHESLHNLEILKVPDAHHPYEIILSHDAFKHIGDLLRSNGLNNHTCVIITSEFLANIFRRELLSIKNPLIIYIKDGEAHKNWANIEYITNKLFEHDCTRQTIIISLGGGTIGDVAGFAAAIYMRGLPVIHVPTSLLAMVDSSVGGKTGIDIPQGKNLLGSFHMPRAVLIQTAFLDTLPPEEFACGMAEIIKHALIGDEALFYDLLHKTLEPQELVRRAIDVKINLVASDPTEANVRAYLNLGHTFAHAIEKVSDYRIKHGEAVAIGLVQACMLASRLQILETDFLPDLIKLLERYKLPTKLPDFSHEKLISAMKHDKKKDAQGLRFILPKKIAQLVIQQVREADIFAKD